MTNHVDGSRDLGRISFGTIVALLVLIAAAGGAYVFASQYGLLGLDRAEPTVEPGITPPAEEPDGRPAWLVGSLFELPPLLVPLHENEPRSRLMVGWIWEYVDDDWSIEIVRSGGGDGTTYLHDMQVMFLASPEGELFRLYDLRRDYTISLVHWLPDERLAWLVRGGRSGLAPVVEFDLATGTNNVSWHDGAVSPANTIDSGVGNVTYLGMQTDGRELWVSYDRSGFTTGVFWRRADGAFKGSVITGEIRRLKLQGFSEDHGVDAWIDVESMTAVYRATFRIDGQVTDDRWIVHDLASDDFTITAPRVPADADCVPAFPVTSSAHFDGGRIVADCRSGGSTTRVLIDPTGESAPQ